MDILLKYFNEFSERQLSQFASLGPLYREWNEKINIISRKDIDGLYDKHVLHSLSIAAVFNFEPGARIIDIGTGGGFPGIPLAIFFPEVEFHLVDSIAKKLKVVDAICDSIGLKNVTTRHSRVEEITSMNFDFAVSRAVAPLKDLWRWSRPLLKKNARVGQAANEKRFHPGLISLKGGDLAAEIQESGTRPRIMEIRDIFPEPYFGEKYLLFVEKP